MTASASVPTLSDDDIDDLLTQFSIVDADGLKPSDDDWTPTYNLRAAAAEGWRSKAAKAAELQSTDLDGDRMSADQVFEHCKDMIKIYAGSASPAMSTSTAEASAAACNP